MIAHKTLMYCYSPIWLYSTLLVQCEALKSMCFKG